MDNSWPHLANNRFAMMKKKEICFGCGQNIVLEKWVKVKEGVSWSETAPLEVKYMRFCPCGNLYEYGQATK